MPVRGSIGKRSTTTPYLRFDIAKVPLLVGFAVLGHVGDARNRREPPSRRSRRKRFGLAEDGGRVQSAAHRHRDGICRAAPARDGVLQMAAERLDVFAERAISQAPAGIEIPVASPRRGSFGVTVTTWAGTTDATP